MNSDKRFQKTLEKWSRTNPQAAVFVPYADWSHLKLSHQGTLVEAEKWAATLDLKGVDLLYVYGIGLGYAYLALKPWLKKSSKHRLVFLEDDLGVIKSFFETEIAQQFLKDKKLILHYFDNLESTHSPLSELYWQWMTLKFSIVSSPDYAKTKQKRFDQLSHKIVYDATMRDAIVDEYLQHGAPFFNNFYQNMLSFEGATLGSAFFNQFKNIPAIICGAGPSLEKHFSLIREVKENSLIFAGGSALNALQSAGLKPHFGAGIDPNPEQEIRLKQTAHINVPFFFRNRLFHKAFQLVQGKKLYIPGSGGYQIAQWFEERFSIASEGEDLDEGFNVANFCISIAYAMGCNPIILLGMDLAYTNLASYAKGVVKKSKVNKTQITQADDLDSIAIERKDIYGKPTFTMWKWIAESQWIGEFAKEHPEVEWINATEGGIGFPNIENQSFKEVMESYLKRSFPLNSKIDGCIQQGVLSEITQDKLVEAQQELVDSLNRCKNHLHDLIENHVQLIKKIEETKALPERLQETKTIVLELELTEEVAYTYVLDIFNTVYNKILEQKTQKIDLSNWKDAVKKLKHDVERWQFLKKVADTNINLILNALQKN